MENGKIVCFAGHRDDWRNVGIEDKLKNTIEELIQSGYTIFYNGDRGYFDKLCTKVVLELKKKYPQIKIYRILANYKPKEEKESWFDDYVMPNIEKVYFKQRITKRNEWMVEKCDILLCNVYNSYNSGAYATLKYAQKLNKKIINISNEHFDF